GPKTSIICSPMTSLKTSIKTITYLSDIGCLEIQGASLRGDDELLHVQRRMHPEAPESSRKAERLRIKPGDSNIKVIY
ncbi:hypothetical protein Q5460_14565, partial [Escherichia coli]|nr:hypothetical protein [Escherichia coli]